MSSTGTARHASSPRTSRSRAILIGAAITAVLAAVVVFGVLLAPKPTDASTGGGLSLGANPVGQAMPATEMPKLGGGTISMASLRGKPLVVNFFASWCPPCNMEAPLLGKAETAWRAKGVTFVGIDVEDQDAYGLAFLKHYGLEYAAGTDATGSVSRAWGVNGYPETFFIGRDGRIRSVYASAIDAATLDARIAQIAGS